MIFLSSNALQIDLSTIQSLGIVIVLRINFACTKDRTCNLNYMDIQVKMELLKNLCLKSYDEKFPSSTLVKNDLSTRQRC